MAAQIGGAMLVELLFLIIVLILLIYLLQLLAPGMDPTLYRICVAVAVVIIIVWLLDAMGVAGGPHFRLLR
jgi:hypothetical protein